MNQVSPRFMSDVAQELGQLRLEILALTEQLHLSKERERSLVDKYGEETRRADELQAKLAELENDDPEL